MFKKAGGKKPQTHSIILTLEKEGVRSNTGVINSSNLQRLLELYAEKNLKPVRVEHSKYCICGKGEKDGIFYPSE